MFQTRSLASRYVKKMKKCVSKIDLKIFEDLEKARKLYLLLYESPAEGRFC